MQLFVNVILQIYNSNKLEFHVLGRAARNELRNQPRVELTEEGDWEHTTSEGEDLDFSEGGFMSPLPSRDQIDASKIHDSSDSSVSDRTLAAL